MNRPMSALSNIRFLLQHAIRVELRNRHGIAGLLVFAVAAVYACYQATGTHAEQESWNALAWVVLLFAGFNAVSKPWADDDEGVRAFLIHAVQPQHWLIARTLYYMVLLGTVSTVTFAAFLLFLGIDHLSGWTAGHYYAGVMLTSTALASLLAMIQALASRAGGGFSLIAVLGLPLIIQHHVFNDGTVANRVPYNGFIFATQIDGLGVATALYIEYGPLGPTVLIIANEVALRVR